MAIEFAELKYNPRDSHQNFIEEVESELYKHRKQRDQLNFISSIIGYIQELHDDHYKDCPNRDSCVELKNNSRNIYLLNGLLDEYGLSLDLSEQFDNQEKLDLDRKLDKILEDIQQMKMGQEAIYNDLFDEIEELKKMYFLGKKNWKQMLAGKTVDMVAGGVIGETVSKKLVEITGITMNNLLS